MPRVSVARVHPGAGVVAVRRDSHCAHIRCAMPQDSESKAYNFAAIWLALLVIAFGIGGSMVLLRVSVV